MLGELVDSLSLLGAPAGVYAWWVSKRRDRHLQRRELYQALELASIDLFRFEADHPNLVESVWAPGALPPEHDVVARYNAENYVAQILNLFEIAVRMRTERGIPEEAFGSWVAWFWSLAGAPGFPELWGDLRPHYVGPLRAVLDEAVVLANRPGGEGAFYESIGRRFDCVVVRDWLHDAAAHAAGSVRG